MCKGSDSKNILFMTLNTFFGPESLNIGYLDPLGILKPRVCCSQNVGILLLGTSPEECVTTQGLEGF